MRFIATKLPLLLAASATIVVGQDPTTTGTGSVSTGSVSPGSSSKCAAQKVVDQCIQNMKFQLENCATYDWDCQCISSTNVVDCYNNCPEHPDRIGAQTIRQQNCANARAYSPSTTASSPSSTATDKDSDSSSMSASSSAYASGSTSTPSGLQSHNKSTDEESDSGSSSEPTKSLTGLEASSSPSAGAAVKGVRVAGGWVAFLGLALGVLF
ncbi:uncharacterized protein N7473_011742 [Penicillium subrubescens]|uniref:GPI anchored serine-threonine rich protein n=1 Tax=Penicillium subrubescens TaxID=1316194 RepID=A0A1Q5TM91_9EURO|nr:uncharacterized protein N7473_011742 [Penicillium subrubescens]KAJ5880689.1 hypothetical protein N7473_011742 [Penicillium subrubescens]OKP01335.1 hypothetical protein PENSUB_7325 [Penicillium subrubescens]